jgi:hypothetical protein
MPVRLTSVVHSVASILLCPEKAAKYIQCILSTPQNQKYKMNPQKKTRPSMKQFAMTPIPAQQMPMMAQTAFIHH